MAEHLSHLSADDDDYNCRDNAAARRQPPTTMAGRWTLVERGRAAVAAVAAAMSYYALVDYAVTIGAFPLVAALGLPLLLDGAALLVAAGVALQRSQDGVRHWFASLAFAFFVAISAAANYAHAVPHLTPSDATQLAAGILATLPPVTLAIIYELVAMERRRAAAQRPPPGRQPPHEPDPGPTAGAPEPQVRESRSQGPRPAKPVDLEAAMSQVAGLGPTARARTILANHLAQGGDANRTGLAAGLANAARCSLRTAQRVIAEHRKDPADPRSQLTLRAIRTPAGGT